ncbi:uncharacterized protein B0H18DRAFT_960652 [Fomitopsis serialis]|uniref:uncharacterized protein n=1 Tax=Fomitopsis serialis TaxID=139415 RepID=UPI00200750B3|nr:uncharacterized protein B0H18DRAFT_960652 [Neoantrodia serialis]KAH9913046.1 hypothetical protein B0H18DRAFT_960652 [Neoantrodia serialis]
MSEHGPPACVCPAAAGTVMRVDASWRDYWQVKTDGRKERLFIRPHPRAARSAPLQRVWLASSGPRPSVRLAPLEWHADSRDVTSTSRSTRRGGVGAFGSVSSDAIARRNASSSIQESEPHCPEGEVRVERHGLLWSLVRPRQTPRRRARPRVILHHFREKPSEGPRHERILVLYGGLEVVKLELLEPAEPLGEETHGARVDEEVAVRHEVREVRNGVDEELRVLPTNIPRVRVLTATSGRLGSVSGGRARARASAHRHRTRQRAAWRARRPRERRATALRAGTANERPDHRTSGRASAGAGGSIMIHTADERAQCKRGGGGRVGEHASSTWVTGRAATIPKVEKVYTGSLERSAIVKGSS